MTRTMIASGLLLVGSLFLPARPLWAQATPRPTLTSEVPSPGRFVRQTAPEYAGTDVHHGLYLPRDWQPNRRYPVIVEYAPNQAPTFGTTGAVADCRLGYYLSRGEGFLWVVMPFVHVAEQRNQPTWWGDEQATITYCLTNLARICDQFGGDRDTIVLVGFSRGAIACGYLGLRDETIADTWLAFWPHSHIDSGRFTPQGGRERLARTRGRATLVTWGENDGAKSESPRGAAMLRELGPNVTAFELPGVEHTDTWIEREGASRRRVREWLDDVLRRRPGTYRVSGRLCNSSGVPLGGQTLQCGVWHRGVTDLQGRFTVRGLTAGTRPLTQLTGDRPRALREVVIEDEDIDLGDLKLPPRE